MTPNFYLVSIKELVLDENNEVKKPVRKLLYDKGLYGELLPKEVRYEASRLEPRELVQYVNERVDIMSLARHIIPDKLTSTRRNELRFRDGGSLAVSQRGWTDFKTGEKGRAYGLVKTFGPTSDYKSIMGILYDYADFSAKDEIDRALNRKDRQVSTTELKKMQAETKAIQEKRAKKDAQERAEKIARAKRFYTHSQPLMGTVGELYLNKRGISSSVLQGAQDIRFTDQMYNTETKRNDHKALLAFARNRAGEITAVQVTYLNNDGTKDKRLAVSKKNLGLVTGSAVSLTPYVPGRPLLVAEGTETGLSLVEGGAQANVRVSLGISNVKNVIEERLSHEPEYFKLLRDHGIDPMRPVLSFTQVNQEMNAFKTQDQKLKYIDQREPLFGINWGSKLLKMAKEKGEGANVFFDLLPAEVAETYHPEACLGIQDQTFTLKQYEDLIKSVQNDEATAQRIDTLMKNTFGESWQERRAQIQDTAAPHENIYHKLMGPEAMRTHAAPTQVVVALDNDRDPSDPSTPKVQEEKLRSHLDALSHKTGTTIETLQPGTPGADYNDLLQEKGGLSELKQDLHAAGLETEPAKGRDRERQGPELEM